VRLTVTLEQRFRVTPDGRAWTEGTYRNAFWDSYLEVFEEVRVSGRSVVVSDPEKGDFEVTGGKVSFAPLPFYVGPKEYVLAARKIKAATKALVAASDAHLFRVPSALSVPAAKHLGRRPFGLEVLGDPAEAIKAVSDRSGAILGRMAASQLREQCLKASCVSYVTREVLQKAYPASGGALSISCSDVMLTSEAYALEPKVFKGGPVRICFIGSMEVPYKGQEILLQACQKLLAEGLLAKVVLLGEGRRKAEFQSYAAGLGLGDRAVFKGFLADPSLVRQELDSSDLFVLPSFTEGLPRAGLEAMARGLPCVCTSVGGLVELLDEKQLVSPQDADSLAERIAWMAFNPEEMNGAAHRNLAKAHEYEKELMRAKRLVFLKYLRDRTEQSCFH
jgi:glycosyltransferase involved in cell wall biosynthesis